MSTNFDAKEFMLDANLERRLLFDDPGCNKLPSNTSLMTANKTSAWYSLWTSALAVAGNDCEKEQRFQSVLHVRYVVAFTKAPLTYIIFILLIILLIA